MAPWHLHNQHTHQGRWRKQSNSGRMPHNPRNQQYNYFTPSPQHNKNNGFPPQQQQQQQQQAA
eukprot:3800321-Karenia_brevis.AAC.1